MTLKERLLFEYRKRSILDILQVIGFVVLMSFYGLDFVQSIYLTADLVDNTFTVKNATNEYEHHKKYHFDKYEWDSDIKRFDKNVLEQKL